MSTDRPPGERSETWVVDVRPTCSKCDRLSVVYTEDGKAFCARHATIFLTDWDGTPKQPPGHGP